MSTNLSVHCSSGMTNRFLHIIVSALLLTGYIFVFSVLPALHSHPLLDQDGNLVVHVQPTGTDSQKSHSPNCIFCLRIHASAFTLTRANPVAVSLASKEYVSPRAACFQLLDQFEHCGGRAPPASIS